MTDYWNNFAKTGDPNGTGLPNWPAYSNAKSQAMHLFAHTEEAGPVVDEEGLKKIDACFKWRREAAADSPAEDPSADGAK